MTSLGPGANPTTPVLPPNPIVFSLSTSTNEPACATASRPSGAVFPETTVLFNVRSLPSPTTRPPPLLVATLSVRVVFVISTLAICADTAAVQTRCAVLAVARLVDNVGQDRAYSHRSTLLRGIVRERAVVDGGVAIDLQATALPTRGIGCKRAAVHRKYGRCDLSGDHLTGSVIAAAGTGARIWSLN